MEVGWMELHMEVEWQEDANIIDGKHFASVGSGASVSLFSISLQTINEWMNEFFNLKINLKRIINENHSIENENKT